MREVPGHNQSIVPDESLARGPDAFLAIRGKWDVRRARVSSVQGPLCLAVADDEDSRCDLGHGCVGSLVPLSDALSLSHSLPGRLLFIVYCLLLLCLCFFFLSARRSLAVEKSR